MQALTEDRIHALFPDVASRDLDLPSLQAVDWGVLDYLGWVHASGHRGYVVYPSQEGLVGLSLSRIPPSRTRRRGRLCSWCHHMHRGSGTAMFSAAVSGTDGRRIVGNVMCSQLDCSLRIRNLCSDPPSTMPETIDLARKIARLHFKPRPLRRPRAANGGLRVIDPAPLWR